MFKQFPPAEGTTFYFFSGGIVRESKWHHSHLTYITADNCFETVAEFRISKPPHYFEGVIYANQASYIKEPTSCGIYETASTLELAKKTFVGKGWKEMSDYKRILEIDLKKGIVAIHTATYEQKRKPMYQWTRTPYTPN